MYLKAIHRQSDRVFIDLLECFRMGKSLVRCTQRSACGVLEDVTLLTADLLEGNVNISRAAEILLNRQTQTESTSDARPIGLYPMRADVDRINNEGLDQNRNPFQEYPCLDGCKWSKA